MSKWFCATCKPDRTAIAAKPCPVCCGWCVAVGKVRESSTASWLEAEG